MIPDDLDSGPLLNAFQPPQVTLVQGGRVRVLQGRHQGHPASTRPSPAEAAASGRPVSR